MGPLKNLYLRYQAYLTHNYLYQGDTDKYWEIEAKITKNHKWSKEHSTFSFLIYYWKLRIALAIHNIEFVKGKYIPDGSKSEFKVE